VIVPAGSPVASLILNLRSRLLVIVLSLFAKFSLLALVGPFSRHNALDLGCEGRERLQVFQTVVVEGIGAGAMGGLDRIRVNCDIFFKVQPQSKVGGIICDHLSSRGLYIDAAASYETM
jgi:hypothetical protein